MAICFMYTSQIGDVYITALNPSNALERQSFYFHALFRKLLLLVISCIVEMKLLTRGVYRTYRQTNISFYNVVDIMIQCKIPKSTFFRSGSHEHK